MTQKPTMVSRQDFDQFIAIAKNLELMTNPGLRFCAERLRERFEDAVMLPSAQLPDDVVAIGSKVHIRDLLTNRTMVLSLQWNGEPARKPSGHVETITPFTALGAAILGQRTGDIVETEQPRRGNYEIVMVFGSESRAGKRHRD